MLTPWLWLLIFLAQLSPGYSQDPGDPELDIFPVRLLFNGRYLGPVFEVFPYFPPEKTRKLRIKSMVFRYKGKEASPKKEDRKFVIRSFVPDTIGIMEFDRRGNLRRFTSWDLWAWHAKALDWEKRFNTLRILNWQYDRQGRLRRQIDRYVLPDSDERADTTHWSYPNPRTIIKRTISPEQAKQRAMDYGVGDDYTQYRMNSKGQLYDEQEITEYVRDDSSDIQVRLECDYNYDDKGRLIQSTSSRFATRGKQYIQKTYSYNPAGFPSTKTELYQRLANEPILSEILYEYDQRGNLIKYYSEGNPYFFEWKYDEKGLPVEFLAPHFDEGGPQTEYLIEIEYFAPK